MTTILRRYILLWLVVIGLKMSLLRLGMREGDEMSAHSLRH